MLSDEKNPGEKTFNDRAPCVKKKASHEARPYRTQGEAREEIPRVFFVESRWFRLLARLVALVSAAMLETAATSVRRSLGSPSPIAFLPPALPTPDLTASTLAPQTPAIARRLGVAHLGSCTASLHLKAL